MELNLIDPQPAPLAPAPLPEPDRTIPVLPEQFMNLNRIRTMYRAWYQPHVRMTREEWEYIAILCLAAIWAPCIGFLVGLILFY